MAGITGIRRFYQLLGESSGKYQRIIYMTGSACCLGNILDGKTVAAGQIRRMGWFLATFTLRGGKKRKRSSNILLSSLTKGTAGEGLSCLTSML